MDYESYLELLKKRRSIRAFKSDPVKDDDVKKIIESVHWAPSGLNMQPWEVVVVKKQALKESIAGFIEEAFKEMMKNMPPGPGGQRPQPPMGFAKAPVFVLLFGDTRTRNFIRSMDDDQWNNLTSSNLAIGFHSMLLAVTTLGLGAQWVSIVSRPMVESQVKELLGIPDFMKLYNMMALGYPDMEPIPKKMRETDEIVHYDACGPDDFRTDDDMKRFFTP